MEVSVRSSDHLILQQGFGLGDLPGCTTTALTEAQAATHMSLQGQPNGGITFDGTTFTALPVPVPPTPPRTKVATGSGAGTGATVVLHQPDPSLTTDVRGIVDVTIGTNPAPDGLGHYPLVVITFGTPWPVAPLGAMIDRVKLAGEDPTALGLVFSAAMVPSGFEIVAQNQPVAGTTYRISYALG